MSLSHRCRENFPAEIRSRGSTYFSEGAVELLSTQEKIWNFKVKGSFQSHYSVELAYDDAFTSLQAKCDCPYYEGGLLCKHVWAAILKAEEEGLEKNIPGSHRLFVLHSLGDDDEEDQEDSSEEEFSRTQFEAPALWQRRLGAIKEQAVFSKRSEDNKSERIIQDKIEVWYVLAPEKSQDGKLSVYLYQRPILSSGDWGKIKELRITLSDIEKLTNADDREILGFLLGVSPEGPSYFPYHICYITQPLYEMILPKLCATQRFIFHRRGKFNIEDVIPLKLRSLRPWSFAMEWQKLKSTWAIEGTLQRDQEKLKLSEIFLITQKLFISNHEIYFLDIKSYGGWLTEIQKHGPILIPPNEEEKFVSELVKIPNLPISNWPENLSWKQVKEKPSQVRLSFMPAHTFDYQLYKFDLEFLYGDKFISKNDMSSVILDAKNKSMILRDRSFEDEAQQRISEITQESREVSVHELPRVADEGLHLGWLVEVSKQKLKTQVPINIQVSSGIDWFDVKVVSSSGESSFDLPTLLSDVQSGKSIVRLGDGTVGVLPEEWLKRLKVIDRLGKTVNGSFQIKKNQASLLEAILAGAPEVQGDQFFNDVRNKIKAFDGVKVSQPSKSFKGELRDYQKVGLGWLEFLMEFGFGGCLADDMGLGKTVQVLALLEKVYKNKKLKPTLIVVPKSLVYNWLEEIKRFAPHLKVLIYGGPDRDPKFSLFNEHQIIITTYSILRIDIEKLATCEFELVILDEAQNIKNSSSQAAKAARILNAKHRLALTGTPVENHMGELWSIFEFLNPGILGSAPLFMDLVHRGSDLNLEMSQVFQRALRPFILRRTKEKVLKELPQKTEQILFCGLENNQQKYYDELKVFYQESLKSTIEKQGLSKSKIHVLEALLRLRQAACHPGLVDKKRGGEESGKLRLLLEKIDELLEEKEHKVLIFSQFTSLLSLVQDRLRKKHVSFEYLDGQTKDRKTVVENFQKENSKSRVFLISLKAGGVGLNLTKADYVFILDPWWNPAVESQAIDRAHRIGQTKPVFAYRIIAKNTVEEKILQLQEQKKKLVEDLFSGAETSLKSLKAEEIQFLLS